MERAIIYARISRDVGQDSLATQEQQCRSYAEKVGYEVAAVFTDVGSGSDPNRPNLWQAIWSMESGDVLLSARLDRVSRSVYLSAHIEDKLARMGCRMVSASGEGTWADSDEDTLVRQILFAMAEYERKIIAARTSAAQINFMKSGRVRNGSPPFGYVEDAGLLVVDPEAMQTVRGIARLMRQLKITARAASERIGRQGDYPRMPAAVAATRIGKTLMRDDFVYWIVDLREDSLLPHSMEWSGPMPAGDIEQLLVTS